MQSWLTSHVLSLALPLILGPLAFQLTQWLKQGITALDNSSPAIKQAVALTITFVLAGVVRFAGDALPNVCILGDDASACLKALSDPNAMQILVSFIISHVLHAGSKQAEASATK